MLSLQIIFEFRSVFFTVTTFMKDYLQILMVVEGVFIILSLQIIYEFRGVFRTVTTFTKDYFS